MTEESTGSQPLARDVWEVTAALRKFGWEPSGGVAGLFETWRNGEGSRDAELLLPVDPTKGDYSDLLARARERLVMWDSHSVVRFFAELDRTSRAQLDKTSFEKESALPSGLISWQDGEDLFSAARATLVAAAKATKTPRRYHGNSSAYLAKHFLESAIMGQTEVGSFVVTALSPSGERFHYSKADSEKTEGYDEAMTTVTGREVIARLESALSAARDALDEFRKTPRVEVFDESVSRGVSYELVVALTTISSGSDDSAVKITFAGADAPDREVEFAFTAPDTSVLARAATHLAGDRPPEDVRISGRVTLLDRPKPGDAGVVRLTVTSGADVNVVRVRLGSDEYETALEAHQVGTELEVSGRLEREGQYFWLYNASQLAVAGDEHEDAEEIETLFDAVGRDEDDGPRRN